MDAQEALTAVIGAMLQLPRLPDLSPDSKRFPSWSKELATVPRAETLLPLTP